MNFRFDRTAPVKDPARITAIQDIINQKGLAAIPFSPLTDIVNQTSLVEVEEERHYFIETETRMRTREWIPFHEGSSDEAIGTVPLLRPQDIPIWELVPNQYGNFECKVYKTARRNICNECLGHKKVECSTCKGSRFNECSNCNGYGLEPCPDCNGTGRAHNTEQRTHFEECWACGGSGGDYKGRVCSVCHGTRGKQKSRTVSVAVPCIRCQGSGKIRCHTCGGKGEIRCSECGATGRIICPECDGIGQVVRGYALRQKDLTIFTCYSMNGAPDYELRPVTNEEEHFILTPWQQPFSRKNCVATWENKSRFEDLPECQGKLREEFLRMLAHANDACPKVNEVRFYWQSIKIYCTSLYFYRFKLEDDNTIRAIGVELDGTIVSGLHELRNKLVEPLKNKAEQLHRDGRFDEAFYTATQATCIDPMDQASKEIKEEILNYMTVLSLLPLLPILAGLMLYYRPWQPDSSTDSSFIIAFISMLILSLGGAVIFFRDVFFHCKISLELGVIYTLWLGSSIFAAVNNLKAGIIIFGIVALLWYLRNSEKKNAAAFLHMNIPDPQAKPVEVPDLNAPPAPGIQFPDDPSATKTQTVADITKQVNSLSPSQHYNGEIWRLFAGLIVVNFLFILYHYFVEQKL